MNQGHTSDCVRARTRAWALNQAPLPPCDCSELATALDTAITALNRNGFVTRSAALYDLAEAVTRHLGKEWNPYGQTIHPDGTITRRDEDIRP